MTARIARASAVLTLVLVALAHAQAPPVVPPFQTGQISCWRPLTDGTFAITPCAATGQDGELRAGPIFPAPRFTDHGDGTFTDHATDLMWPTNGNLAGVGLTEAAAYAYMEGMNLGLYPNFGYSDWRLPNRRELLSLVDYGRYDPALAGLPFLGVASFPYWAVRTYGVFLFDGAAAAGRNSEPGGVWPVRGNSLRLSQTSASGDSAGVAWPYPRFTGQSVGTVMDTLSGLIWQPQAMPYPYDPGLPPLTWQEALDYVAAMNEGLLPNHGHIDWRLPNIRELESLVDLSRAFPALASDRPFWFDISPGLVCEGGGPCPDPRDLWSFGTWSSTTWQRVPGHAWIVHWSDGRVDASDKNTRHKVWPLRGGQVGLIHTITGTVIENGTGLPLGGVTLTLSGAASATAVTAPDGTYRFSYLANGDYTVTPAERGYAFDPAGASVTIAGRDATQDFWATSLGWISSISGTVTENGVGLGGVSVALSGVVSATATTAPDGTYEIARLGDGNYTVTPALAGYTFTPSTASVTLPGGPATRDFTATPRNPVVLSGPDYGVEGYVYPYHFGLDSQRATTLIGPLTLDIEVSPGLELASQSGDEWSCVPGAPGHQRCTWNADLPPGSATFPLVLVFTITPPPYAASCGTSPSPCVTVQATLTATGQAAILYTGVDRAGGGNSIPRAQDDVVWLFGPLTFAPLANDLDPDQDPLSISIETPPAAGDVVVNMNGTVTYTPHGDLQTLSGADSFRYRVSDGRGGSATALVSINSITPAITSSKPVIDVGPVAPGRLAAGGTSLTSSWGIYSRVTFEPVSDAEIAAALAGTGYEPARAVSDPAAFRGESIWFASSEWETPPGFAPTRWTQIYFRPSPTVGQVSVARAVFTAYHVRGSLPDTAMATTTAYVMGVSTGPANTPVLALDDSAATPAETPVEIDVLANDISLANRTLGVAVLWMVSNATEWVFKDVYEGMVGGVTWTADGLRLIYTPPAGFTGTTSFTYGIREPSDSSAPRPYDDNLYYATVTVTVGGAPPAVPLVVTKAGGGAGIIRSTPGAIDCGATCGAMLPPDSEIVLTAHASAGSAFAGWSGACTGTGPCNLVVDAATSVTATFTLQSFPLSTARSGNGSGSVTSSPPAIECGTTCEASFEYGTTLTLTATPATGSRFTGWTGACRGPGPCVVTIDAAKSVVAEFSLESFTLTVTKSGSGGAIVSVPAGIDCGPTCDASFDYGTEVTLAAMPAAGSLFTGWSGLACRGSEAGCVLTIDADTSVGATFVSPPDVRLEQSVFNFSSGALSSCCVTAHDGDLLVFYFSARNAATAQPTTGQVTVVNTLPAGLNFEEASTGCSRSDQVVTCVSTETLGGDEYVGFDVHARVATGAGVGQSVPLTNLVAVSTPGDVNAGNDTGTISITVQGPVAPDLRLEQSIVNMSTAASSSDCCVTAQAGDLLRIRLTARNASSAGSTIGPVTLTDILPDGLNFEESPDDCSAAGQVVTCALEPFLPNGSHLARVYVRVGTGMAPVGQTSPVMNTARVSTSDDANPSDNESNPVTITIQGPLGLPLPGGGLMGISVPSPQALAGVTLDQTTYIVPAGVRFLFGAIRYSVTLGPGEEFSSATMIFTPPLPADLVLHKADTGAVLGVIPVWDGRSLERDCWRRELDTATSTTIVLTLTDNGPFDLNPATGVIADPVLFGIIVNDPPTADAGASQTVEATSASGATVTLSGSGADPNGDPLTFAWSGPCGTAASAQATLACPLGTSMMTLTVSDGKDGLATSTVPITVVDTTPPAIACGVPGTSWHATDVTVVCWATDSGAGLSDPADGRFVLSTSVASGTETAGAMTGTRTVCDVAGNCATGGPIGPIKVDKLAPSITVGTPLDGAAYVLNQSLAAAFSCSDGGAGLAACAGDVATGAMLVTSPVGTQGFTVTATDAAGNSAIVSRTYRVIFATDGLCEGAAGHAMLDPIAQGASSVFKQGRTVPAKFRVCDAVGQSIGTPGTVSSFRLVQIVSGTATTDVNADVPSTTPDGSFRCDPLARQWIYNISTRSYLAGQTYYFVVTLSDGTDIGFGFGLR